jgi:phytoene/squalene synthetase
MGGSQLVTADEAEAALRRVGIQQPSEAMIARVAETGTATLFQLGRIPRDLGKDLEPANVFYSPLA